MTRFITMLMRPRRLLTMSALIAAWCALWGNVSIANLASGLVLSWAATSVGLANPQDGGVRAIPLLRLLGVVGVDLVKSTVSVAHEILTPTDYTDEAIIEVPLSPEGREHLQLLVVAITLTPGTAVIDADPDTGLLTLHLLHGSRSAETVDHVNDLTRLACEALPVRSVGAGT